VSTCDSTARDSHQSVTIVPARGGLGEEVELQASTVAAQLARRLNGSYRMLHVPDNLSPEAMQSLINESSVAEVLKIVHSADLVVHGIGAAAEMAERRGTRPTEIASILQAGAMGEAFGFYFDAQGHIVYNMPSVGLGLNELDQVQQRIAVAGGKQKAAAICAVLKGCGGHVLVTDEGAARAMEEILK
jgi:central glycolytic genes regulator